MTLMLNGTATSVTQTAVHPAAFTGAATRLLGQGWLGSGLFSGFSISGEYGWGLLVIVGGVLLAWRL